MRSWKDWWQMSEPEAKSRLVEDLVPRIVRIEEVRQATPDTRGWVPYPKCHRARSRSPFKHGQIPVLCTCAEKRPWSGRRAAPITCSQARAMASVRAAPRSQRKINCQIVALYMGLYPRSGLIQ